MNRTGPGCLFILLLAAILAVGGLAVCHARSIPRGYAHVKHVRRPALHHHVVRKGRKPALHVHAKGRHAKARTPKVAVATAPSTNAAPAVLSPPTVPDKPEAAPKPVATPKPKPARKVHVSRSELAAQRIDSGLGQYREIVKMLKTGTERGGVFLGYVPKQGPELMPSKLICEIDLPNKDVIDEYYYSGGRLIFVRETVRNYSVNNATKLMDFGRPIYKEPTAIPFVRGHIAGSPKLRRRERSLLFDSRYLQTLLRANGNQVDVEHWVKSPQI